MTPSIDDLLQTHFAETSKAVRCQSYHTLDRVRDACYDYAFEHGLLLQNMVPITPQQMNATPLESNQYMAILADYARECAAALFHHPSDAITFDDAFLVTSGGTLPIKANVKLLDKEGNTLQKSLFIKMGNTARVIGLELYNLIGEVESDYHFAFNEDVVLEEALAGDHDAAPEANASSINYVRGRIKADLVSWFIGMDDLHNLDSYGQKKNYLVSEGKTVRIIDFNVVSTGYTAEKLVKTQEATRKEMKVPTDEYEALLREEEKFFFERVKRHAPKLTRIIELLESCDKREWQEYGAFLNGNLERVLYA